MIADGLVPAGKVATRPTRRQGRHRRRPGRVPIGVARHRDGGPAMDDDRADDGQAVPEQKPIHVAGSRPLCSAPDGGTFVPPRFGLLELSGDAEERRLVCKPGGEPNAHRQTVRRPVQRHQRRGLGRRLSRCCPGTGPGAPRFTREVTAPGPRWVRPSAPSGTPVDPVSPGR